MQYKFLILSVFVISWLSCYSAQGLDHLELEINKEQINCVNAKKLLLRAQSDTSRLEGYTSNLKDSMLTLDSISGTLNQGCDSLLSAGTDTSLIQTASQTFSSMGSLQQKLKATLLDAGLSKASKKKLTSTLEILVEISEDRASTDKEMANLQCEHAKSKVQDFKNHMNDVLLDIQSNYLDSYLPVRLNEVNNVLLKCPITQTGLFSQNYLRTGNVFEQRVPRERFQDYKIPFNQTFSEVPSVALSLTGFDLDTELPAVAALVTKVTESDFTLRIHVVPYARLYAVQVSYLATIPGSSGIYPKLHMIDFEHDKELSDLAERSGPRSIEKKVKLPAELQNEKVGVVTFLNGFSFGAGADPRLKVSVSDVSNQDFTLRYSTAGSTRFLSAITNNIIYKKSDKLVRGAAEFAPQKNGHFYSAFGTRSESAPLLNIGNYKAKPEIFVGLFALDFTTGYNYRVSQELDLLYDGDQANIDLAFQASGDTKINLAKSSVFYTCNTKQC